MIEVLNAIKPSCDGLLLAMRVSLTDEFIQEMAESDVLIHEEVEANKAALFAIRRSGSVPGCLPWNPGEVCNLQRWEQRTDATNALMKVFGCWILIKAYTKIESLQSGLVDGDDECAIVALVEGALDFGEDFPTQTARFLYWAYLSLIALGEHRSVARPFYVFGMLVSIASMPDGVSDEEFLAIGNFLHEEERRVRYLSVQNSYESTSDQFNQWLVGLAGHGVGNFQSRCYKLVQRAHSAQQGKSAVKSRFLDEILSQWPAYRPTT